MGRDKNAGTGNDNPIDHNENADELYDDHIGCRHNATGQCELTPDRAEMPAADAEAHLSV